MRPPPPETSQELRRACARRSSRFSCQLLMTSALVMFSATRHPALHTSMHLPQPSHLA